MSLIISLLLGDVNMYILPIVDLCIAFCIHPVYNVDINNENFSGGTKNMKKPLGEILTRIRKNLGYSQYDVSKLMKMRKFDASNKVISSWENDTRVPNAYQLLALCEILQVVDIAKLFGITAAKSPYDELNEEGQKKISEYMDLLLTSNLYTADRVTETSIYNIRSLPIYNLPVSAGTGQFLDSSTYDMSDVDGSVPLSANFGVRISGDSMEPKLQNGQIVWIRQQQTLENGEIGIFLLDGNAYCIQLFRNNLETKLISLNENYEPIVIGELNEMRVFGLVVG